MGKETLLVRLKFARLIGKRIREVRLKQGVSMRDFESLDHGFDMSILSKIEAGKKLPSTYTVYKICKALKVSHREFYRGFEP